MENPPTVSVTEVILIATAILCLLACVFYVLFILFKKRIEREQNALRETQLSFIQQLNDAMMDAEQRERTTLAMDLHDEIGGFMTLMRFKMLYFERHFESDPKGKQEIKECNEILFKTATAIKQISYRISLDNVVKFGLQSDFTEIMNDLEYVQNLGISFNSNLEDLRFEKDIEINVHRIVKELLNNILKYGETQHIDFNAVYTHSISSLNIEIKYQGKGIDNHDFSEIIKNTSQLGLKSIQARVSHLKGTIDFLREKEDFWLVKLKIPCHASS